MLEICTEFCIKVENRKVFRKIVRFFGILSRFGGSDVEVEFHCHCQWQWADLPVPDEMRWV